MLRAALKSKKGAIGLQDAPALIITLVVIGIVASLGLTVLGDLEDTQTANSAEANATGDAIEGISSFTDLMPVIGIVVAIVIVLGVIFMLWRPGKGGM